MLLFLFWGNDGRAQKVEASVNKNPVGAGDRFKYSITIKDAQGEIHPPSFDEFPQVYGSSRSRKMQMINGKVSRELTQTFAIQAPKKAGTYSIEAPKVETGKETLEGNSIELQVKGNVSGDDEKEEPDLEAQKNKRLIGRIRTNKTSAFKGEEVMVTYEIYSRYRNLGFSRQEFPAIDGAWSEEVEQEVGWEDGVERIDGKPYKKAVLRRTLIYPQKSGELRIEPMKLTCEVNRGFFRKGEKVKVKSNSPSIQIKPFPDGAPESFKGDVGNFELEAKLDKKESKIDGSVNLKVQIRGRGNINLIGRPEVELPPELESYDPETDQNVNISKNGISGNKEWKFLIIPRQGGDYSIGPIEFSYFNPRKENYDTLRSGPFQLHVKEERASESQRPRKEKVSSVEEDLRYIRDLNDLREKGEAGEKRELDLGLLIPPLAGGLFFIFITYRRKNREKERKSRRSAKARLKDAAKALERGDRPGFHEETHKALQEYLSERTGLTLSEVSKERIHEKMTQRGIPEEVIEKALKTLEECEILRYAPGKNVSDEAVYEDTVALIAELEESWK